MQALRARLADGERSLGAGTGRTIPQSLHGVIDELNGLVGRLEANAHLASAVESSDDTVIAQDLDGTILSWNRGAQRLFGFAPFEAVGHSISSMIADDRRAEIDAALVRVRVGERIEHFETVGLCKEGKRVAMSIALLPIRDPAGRVTSSWTLVRDTGERRRASLAELSAEISRVLVASSDLRQMLQSCCESLVRSLDAALVRVWILNGAQRVLEMEASAGIHTTIDDEYARIPVGERLIGQIAAAGRPIVTNALARDAPLAQDRTRARRERIVSFAGYPLQVGERTIGVIVMFARQTLDDAVVRSFGSIADAIALGIDRRRTEEALQRSEARLAEAQEVARIGSFDWDLTTGQMFWSDALLSLFGRVRGSAPLDYAALLECVHPDDRRQMEESLERGLRSGGRHENEFRVVRPDGTVRYLRAQAMSVCDATGRVVRLVGTNQDVTEQRLAEEKAREAETRLRAFFESVQIALLEALPDGTVLSANPALARMLGYAGIDELRRMKVQDFYDEPFQRTEGLDRLERDGVLLGRELRLRRKDGTRVWGRINARRTVDAQGNVLLEAAVEDVTEKRLLEESLRQSQTQLQEAQELAHIGSWDWDLDVDRATWSPEMLRLYGCDPASSAPGQDVILRSIHPEDREEYLQSLQRILTSEDYQESTVRIFLPDGRMRYLHGRGRALRDASGRPVRLIGTSQDVTEQRQAEDQVRRSEAMLARAQQIAHLASWQLDFENPDDPMERTRLSWSDEAYRIYGCEPGAVDVSVDLFNQALPPQDRQAVARAAADAIQGGKPYSIEHRVIRTDGTERTLLEQGEIVRDDRGRPLRMIGTALDITELKRAEARVRDLFETVPIAIFEGDPDGTIRLANPATAQMFGFASPDEMVGTGGADLYADRATALAFAARLRAEGILLGCEAQFRRRDGSLFWGRMSLRVVRNSQGRARRLEATLEDITEQRKAEARFRELFESVPIGIMETRTDGTILLVNPTTVQMFGCSSADEMLGRNVSERYVESAEMKDVTRVLRKEGLIRGREVRFRRADGSMFWARLSLRLARDPHGRALRFEATFEDVTERRRVEEALRESEVRLRVALGSLPVTVFTLDHDLRYTWVHNSVAPSGEDPIGKTPADLFPTPVAAQMMAEQRQVLATGGQVRSELSLMRDGTVRVYDRTLEAVRDPRGDVIGIAGIAFDITERKEMEGELLQARDAALEASRLKSAFLANMSHEIRTPLNVILGFTSLLEPSDDLQHEFIDSIRKASRRLLVTVQGVLDMSRIETGTFDVRMTPVDVARVVGDVVRDFEPEAQAKGLTLDRRIRAAPPPVSFDEYCLRNALGRLIENAIKFTERGSVTVTVEGSDKGEFYIDVEDTGIGIAQDYLPKLFEPFTQEESGDTRSFEGTGVGLALTQRYLAKNGARVEVRSEKGKGSCFRIVIPLAAGAVAAAVPAVRPKSPESANRSLGILLVEDDVDNQTLVRAVLGNRYAIFVASSAAEAREKLSASSKEIRAVLLDLSLRGEEDGLAFAMWVRSSAQWSRLPIVAVTAHAFPSDRRKALDAGCDDFIAKPFDRDQLLATLEGLIVP